MTIDTDEPWDLSPANALLRALSPTVTPFRSRASWTHGAGRSSTGSVGRPAHRPSVAATAATGAATHGQPTGPESLGTGRLARGPDSRSGLGDFGQVWRFLDQADGRQPDAVSSREVAQATESGDFDFEFDFDSDVDVDVDVEEREWTEKEKDGEQDGGEGEAEGLSRPGRLAAPPWDVRLPDHQDHFLYGYLRMVAGDRALDEQPRGYRDVDSAPRIQSRCSRQPSASINALLATASANQPAAKSSRPSKVHSMLHRPVVPVTQAPASAAWAPLSLTDPLPIRPDARPLQILPLRQSTAAERKRELVLRLVREFPGEAPYLVGPFAVRELAATTSPDPGSVHVFVDASNIMIGFYETLKKKRRIGQGVRTRRVSFAFHSFALILERGRPVAKRILVGSGPRTDTTAEADRCGYETCILKRVTKLQAHVPRDGRANENQPGSSGFSSGPETAVRGRRRMAEQGVDELLHLKMLESVVDAAKPSTIVLATGDAAEAEYSAGFLRMVERALDRGWAVELVTFSRNISSAYKNRDFNRKWSSNFRILYLDPYAELLLDL